MTHVAIFKNKLHHGNVPDPSPPSTQMTVGWGMVWLARLRNLNKIEQHACTHACSVKTILSSPSALLSDLDHFYNGFEVSFDL